VLGRGPTARDTGGAEADRGGVAITGVVQGDVSTYTINVPRPVTWPVRVGVVPPQADCYQHRAVTEGLSAVTTGGGTAVLCQVMSGLGGVGKTQLAAARARQLWEAGELDLLVWVSAASRSAIVATYAQAHTAVTGVEVADAEQAASSLLAWLASTERTWLVVLDDLTDPGDLRGLWPPNVTAGRTIVTTRRRDAALAGSGRTLITRRQGRMRREWDPEDLIAYWTLLGDDWARVGNKTGATRLGFALLLKYFELDARFPCHAGDVPKAAVDYMAEQVKVDARLFAEYAWSGRTIEYHRAQIREALGFRESTREDEERLAAWLAQEVCPVELGEERLREAVLARCRAERIEPAGRIDRILGAAQASFERQFTATIAGRITEAAAKRLEQLPDLVQDLDRRREKTDRTGTLSYPELERLWSRESVGLREKCLWRLLYETAARAEEALSLNVEDVNLANKRAVVVSKGGDRELLHFQSGSARLLPRLIGGRQRGPLFLADRPPVPSRAPATEDLCPETGRARLSYRRAAELFVVASGAAACTTCAAPP
jgi:integrase